MVGEVFFVARYHVENSRQGVEREVQVPSVDREENPLSVSAFGTRLLVFDGGFKKQSVGFDEQAVSQAFTSVTEFCITVLQKILCIGGDAVLGMKQMVEHHFQCVAQPISQFWDMN